ncbi:hypothetical protein MIMGU_mgv1a011067mg [Erythranthe guttata]|uniref:Myb-like domain-containing protein n=1 Tax=Erythranthe guttata TaxID=4155 RepID=A0A022RTR3_ERYGU|nr:hypothetical protein MIMGU_mgv1a011067mg [Erythranthe guttata]
MSTTLSPSSHDDDHHHHHIPTATLALPSSAAATSSASRRLPPPCWSPDETVALIDAYRDKWYSLRRGNLRANHWQEVADDVASRCPASPPKTAVQCRHKMEKLRKRYRAEIQRSAAHGGVRRYTSSWVHFHIMHAMEKGPNPTPPSSDDDDEEEENDHRNSIKRINDLYNHNQKGGFAAPDPPETNGSTSGFRIKIPGRVTSAGGGVPTVAKVYSKFDEMGSGAIQGLGEGFMRMEKVKMDMVRQIEEMRMEMELKRTEMILESEQRIVEAFAKSISERNTKRAKRNSNTPEC